jgi:hypothetical protein
MIDDSLGHHELYPMCWEYQYPFYPFSQGIPFSTNQDENG